MNTKKLATILQCYTNKCQVFELGLVQNREVRKEVWKWRLFPTSASNLNMQFSVQWQLGQLLQLDWS